MSKCARCSLTGTTVGHFSPSCHVELRGVDVDWYLSRLSATTRTLQCWDGRLRALSQRAEIGTGGTNETIRITHKTDRSMCAIKMTEVNARRGSTSKVKLSCV